MTRLTETDVTHADAGPGGVRGSGCARPRASAFADLALRTATDESRCVQLRGARVAAVPDVLRPGRHPGVLGLRRGHTAAPRLRGVVTTCSPTCAASRRRSPPAAQPYCSSPTITASSRSTSTKGCTVDDDPATADGYVTALEAAAGGLEGREVLVLGLGRVGRAAVRRLTAHGATVFVAEPDAERVAAALEVGLDFELAGLAEGLERCDLVFDASPAADVIDAGDLRAGDDRRGARHAVGVHRGGAGGPRRAPHPRAAGASASRSWRRARCSSAGARPGAGVVQSRGAGGRSEGSAWALNPRRRV